MGEYANATNTEDAVAIIVGHLGWVPDAEGDTTSNATAITAGA